MISIMKTKLGKDVQTGTDIVVNDKERRSGMYILGVQGRGKSALLAYLIYQDLEKGYGTIVFDAHGDLIRYVIALLPPERLSKTYLLDMTDTEFPIGLNLFDCADPSNELERAVVVERVLHVFERLWPEIKGILLGKLLRYITLTFIECQGYTLADVRRLLRDDAFRSNIVSRLTNEEVKAYWLEEYNAMSHAERRKETQALDNRLAAFLSTPFIKNIVCQRKTTIDFRRAIQEREVLLINLPKEMKEHAALIGTILLAHLHAATFAFGNMDWNKRPGFSLFVDEFQNFATSDFAELYKEGRKDGARIIVAHQDRHDLIPENRSATLTAYIIVSFQPTPSDAAEIAPLFFDATAQLRPERIYTDVIRRLGMHTHQEVQDFCRQYVLPLQKQDAGRKDESEILELLQALLYQSLTTETINEPLFEAYLQHMYSLLKLTFTVPQQKRKHRQDQLLQREKSIATLQAFLVNDRAFQEYLVIYYSRYPISAAFHKIERNGQPFVAEDVLLADAAYWDYVLGYASGPRRKLPEEVLKELEGFAKANNVLRLRDTPEKIIAQERAQIVKLWNQWFEQLWEHITTLHRLKGKYATNMAVQAFHESIYRTYLATPIAQKPAPVFLYPVGSRKAGIISERTRVEDLIIEPLTFDEDNLEEAGSWIPYPGYAQPFLSDEELYDPEASEAGTIVTDTWHTIVHHYQGMQDIKPQLKDEGVLLKAYCQRREPTLVDQLAINQSNTENMHSSLMEIVCKEASRNAWLGSRMNTVEKLIQLRKDELLKKIAFLIEERDAYKATLPPLEREIEQEIAAIEEQRSAFRASMRRIIQLLIDDPGPLGERRIPKESDIKEKLLNLPKRQALVRVGGDLNQKPRIYSMQTLNVPQAAKQDETERRLHQIRGQTRRKYGRPRNEVEQELRDSEDLPGSERKPGEDEESHGPWYEE
jgi:hypothetical protein